MISQNRYIYRGVILILLFFISFYSFSTDQSADTTVDEINIQYLEGLIDRLELSPFIDSFAMELKQGQERFVKAVELLNGEERESAIVELQVLETLLTALLERERLLTLEEKSELALEAIVEAGEALEKASFTLFINDKGEPQDGFVYKFSLDERVDYSLPEIDYSQGLSYKDAVIKAAIYLEQAKEAYDIKNYDHALNYASLTAKVAQLFSDNGIKEIYSIKKGDCLWDIAKREGVYGDSFYWPLLYRANKALIKDPDTIEPGDELIIPHFE